MLEDKADLEHLVKTLNFGDEIVLLQLQQLGLLDHPKRWPVIMPERKGSFFDSSRDKASLASKLKSVILALPSFFKSVDGATVLHTDIFTTMQLVGEYVHDGGGRSTTLVLLFDMLQSAGI